MDTKEAIWVDGTIMEAYNEILKFMSWDHSWYVGGEGSIGHLVYMNLNLKLKLSKKVN